MRQVIEDRMMELQAEVRAGQVARFKELTEVVLPALARAGRWPVRLDHCFKRVCLDWAFGDVWYRHLARPAERHIAGEALSRAVRCAEEIARRGPAVLEDRNAASLRVRGKAARHLTRETAKEELRGDG